MPAAPAPTAPGQQHRQPAADEQRHRPGVGAVVDPVHVGGGEQQRGVQRRGDRADDADREQDQPRYAGRAPRAAAARKTSGQIR